MSPDKLMQLAESMASKQVQKLGKLETYEQLLLYLEVLQVGCPQGWPHCAAASGGCGLPSGLVPLCCCPWWLPIKSLLRSLHPCSRGSAACSTRCHCMRMSVCLTADMPFGS